ncbi:unnamed protein product [Candidula unifasciata]|uniref:Ubiquitin-like protein ATG12 n=1 Tax=Candidula unifasciata TaxID=100452 RepID=A0A8S3YKR6_9EUPU|nr:unnamed protein product [Candidula unifasciata]
MSEKEERDNESDVSTPTLAAAEAAESDSKTTSESPKLPSSPVVKQKSNSKVDILLKPAGDAPIMKKKKWTVERSRKIAGVAEFIKKFIKMEPSESLFLYVNQSFAPSPDTEIGSIFDCFGSDGKLVLHYCRTQAWG